MDHAGDLPRYQTMAARWRIGKCRRAVSRKFVYFGQ
jgi:hypothetical protein